MRGTRYFHMPYWRPDLTFGPWHPQSGWLPGPSGPIPDPRQGRANVGPFFGRRVQPLNTFAANTQFFNIFPQQPINNRWATFVQQQYIPGWQKRPPTPSSGF